VLVQRNTIQRIYASPIDASRMASVTVVNWGGRVLMPGLIDAHWHAFMAAQRNGVGTGYPLKNCQRMGEAIRVQKGT
jgi:imidazolonepropionase-like amidohydrolase